MLPCCCHCQVITAVCICVLEGEGWGPQAPTVTQQFLQAQSVLGMGSAHSLEGQHMPQEGILGGRLGNPSAHPVHSMPFWVCEGGKRNSSSAEPAKIKRGKGQKR